MKNPLRFLLTVPLFGLFVSCGAVSGVKNKTSAGLAAISDFSLSDLRPNRIKVVEVRENDLRELPTGREQALAYSTRLQNSRRGWGIYRGPVDFKEPVLPSDAGALDGSLLPPRTPQ